MPAPLGTRFFERILLPGDHLLYSGTGLVSWLIKVKTWSPVSHIEVYVGNGKSFASRDGIGVGVYDLRADGLTYVLRPIGEFDVAAGLRWAKTVNGQKYDWWGLARFFTIGRGQKDRQFCSEAATRFDRATGLVPFHPSIDADTVSPGMFLDSTAFDHWWVKK